MIHFLVHSAVVPRTGEFTSCELYYKPWPTFLNFTSTHRVYKENWDRIPNFFFEIIECQGGVRCGYKGCAPASQVKEEKEEVPEEQLLHFVITSCQDLLQPLFYPFSFVVFIVVSRFSEKKRGISSDGYGCWSCYLSRCSCIITLLTSSDELGPHCLDNLLFIYEILLVSFCFVNLKVWLLFDCFPYPS